MTIQEEVIRHAVSLGREAPAFYQTTAGIIGLWKKGKQMPNEEKIALYKATQKAHENGVAKVEVREDTKTEAPTVEGARDIGGDGTGIEIQEPAPTQEQVSIPVEIKKREAKKVVAICAPVYLAREPITEDCIRYLCRRDAVLEDPLQAGGTMVHQARNIIADAFMKTSIEWSLWLDHDMIVPLGPEKSEWFRDICGVPDNFPEAASSFNIVNRLANSGKKLVSALYFGREHKGNGKPMYYEGMVDSAENRSSRVYSDLVKPTKAFGGGCMLVHREVFAEIRRSHGNLEQKPGVPFPYFQTAGIEGEDFSFCLKADKAGFTPFIDLGCIAGHIGKCVRGPWNTKLEGA